MDNVLEIGLWLLGVFLFVQLVAIVIGTSRYLKIPLRRSIVDRIPREQAGDQLPVLDTAAAELLRHGFRYLYSLRATRTIAIEGLAPLFSDVYFNEEHAVTATVNISELPTPSKLCEVYLSNEFADGRSLVTVNGYRHALMRYPRPVTLEDGYAADFAGHLAHHMAARERMGGVFERTPATVEQARAFGASMLARLCEEGQAYVRSGSGADAVYGLRFFAALASLARLRRAAVWMKKAQAAPAIDFGHATVLAERHVFVHTLCVMRGMEAPTWFRRVTFVGSAALFLGLGAWWWGATGALAIAAVVLLHEAGHWAAMKQAGFRDVHVFFVPGMGGATSGEKHEASPFTHLGVYLAGPLPGLLLALAGLASIASGAAPATASWYPVLMAFMSFSLLINAFNLLPVLPLDGGRIVELFVVARLPWLRFVFSIGSGLAFVAVGYASGDAASYAIGALMLFVARHHYYVARAGAAWLRQDKQALSPSAEPALAAERLYDFLRQPPFAAWPFPTRLGTALALLPRVHGRLPSWKESVAGLAIYAACIVLPLAAVAGMAWSAPERMFSVLAQASASMVAAGDASLQRSPAARAGRNDDDDLTPSPARRDAAIAAATTPAARFEALDEAIDATRYDNDGEALRYARMLYAESAADPEHGGVHAGAALQIAGLLDARRKPRRADLAEIARLHGEAEAILQERLARNSSVEDADRLARVWKAMHGDASGETALALRRRIVTLYQEHGQRHGEELGDARLELARELDRAGKPDDAEDLVRTLLDDAGADPAPAPAAAPAGMADRFKLAAAWMYLAHGKPDEAARLVPDAGAIDAEIDAAIDVDEHGTLSLRWMTARRQGDWADARRHALAMSQRVGYRPASWWEKLLWRDAPDLNYNGALMLIEAERQLGHGAAADALVARLRKMHEPRAAAADAASTHAALQCRIHVYDDSWERMLQQALSDIERRELQCEPAPPSLSCPATTAEEDDEDAPQEEKVPPQ